jgi:ribosomal protein L11 methyltransferase
MHETVKERATRIDILVPKGVEELFPENLYQLSGPGVWIEDIGEDVLIKCYPERTEEFLGLLHTSGIPVKEVSLHEEEAVDYAGLTRKYFRPIRIEDVTIVPPWSAGRRQGRRIIIDPGMAFGTGRHESTRIMIKLMKETDMAGKTLLDLGCGSAILSLYGRLLGAARITAVDNDMDTVFSAKKNLDLNGADNIDLACANLEHVRGSYDIVLANLDIRTFSQHARGILRLVVEGGSLIISGILKKERRELLRLFAPLLPVATEGKNAWCGFIFNVSPAHRIDNGPAVR